VRQIVLVIFFGILGIGLIWFFISRDKTEPVTPEPTKQEGLGPRQTTIGISVEGREILAYTYGDGEKHLLFIGGIHGGYEWNTVVLSYMFLDYLDADPTVVPENITVTVIPSLNPDGVYKVISKEGRFASSDVPLNKSTVSGRFNAREVDLNRNFDCKWQPKSMWRNNSVSAGSAPFSEPEARALRDFILLNTPRAVIFWHSQANAVYASQCKGGVLPETLNILDIYSRASGYVAVKSFDAYQTSGDAEGWLASINIPTITVELKTHETIEWEQNLAGIKALFEYYNLLIP
jgi:g-D-glutamyl-meso-diaminopimelate peptidase